MSRVSANFFISRELFCQPKYETGIKKNSVDNLLKKTLKIIASVLGGMEYPLYIASY